MPSKSYHLTTIEALRTLRALAKTLRKRRTVIPPSQSEAMSPRALRTHNIVQGSIGNWQPQQRRTIRKDINSPYARQSLSAVHATWRRSPGPVPTGTDRHHKPTYSAQYRGHRHHAEQQLLKRKGEIPKPIEVDRQVALNLMKEGHNEHDIRQVLMRSTAVPRKGGQRSNYAIELITEIRKALEKEEIKKRQLQHHRDVVAMQQLKHNRE